MKFRYRAWSAIRDTTWSGTVDVPLAEGQAPDAPRSRAAARRAAVASIAANDGEDAPRDIRFININPATET